ncbi:MAG: O-antigen ligase family protein [Candidatus Hydrogenedentota bacterium]
MPLIGYLFLFILVPVAMTAISREAYFIKYFFWVIGLLFLYLASPGSRYKSTPLLIFVIAAFISSLFAVNPHISFAFFINVLLWYFTFLFTRQSFSMVSQDKIFPGLLFTAYILGIYGILESYGIEFFDWKHGITSTFGNPNFFSDYLIVVIPLSIYYFFKSLIKKNYILTFFYSIGSIVLIISLVIAKSRGAYLGLAGGITYIVIALLFHSAKRMLLTMFFLLFIALLPVYKTFYNEILTIKNVIRGGFEVRLPIWQSTFEIIRDFNLTGVGLNNFKVTYPHYRLPEEKSFSGINLVHHSHNDFLQFFCETGFIGITFFVLFLIITIIVALKSKEILNIILSSSLIAISISSFFSFPFYLETPPVLFFAFSGIINSAPLSERMSSEKFYLKRLCGLAFFFILVFYFSELLAGAYLKAGLYYKDAGDYNTANFLLERSSKLNRCEFLSHYNLGESYLRRGLSNNNDSNDLLKSKEIIRETLRKIPYEPAYWNNLAVSSFYLNDYMSAAKYYLISLRAYPFNNVEAMVGLISSYISEGAEHLNTKEYSLSESYFLMAYRLNKDNPVSAHNLAYLYQLNDATDKAIFYYERVIKINKVAQNDLVSLGDLYLKKRESQKARDCYNAAIELDTTTDAYRYAVMKLKSM